MGSKASWWMSCFENTASQGNLNDRGLVRPDRSEDEPSGAKSFLVLHIQACWAEMGACSISVTGTRYEDVEARPWASWKATERTAQHTPRTTGSDSFLFCFVLFCFVATLQDRRILVPQPGIKCGPQQWEHWILSGPPWNSQSIFNRGKTWSDVEEERRAYFTFYFKLCICNTFTCLQKPESMRRCGLPRWR